MNPSTGHLMSREAVAAYAAASGSSFLPGYVEVPDHLERAARAKLAGKSEATVSLTSGGKLSMFAAEQRKLTREKNQRRGRNKTAKRSRRRNR